MRILLFLFITFQLSNCHSQTLSAAKSVDLYLILEKNKFGYINEDGKVIIKPKFLGAGEFSEGLAPARLNGTYGYINTKGEFVIKPQFDYATEFHEGFAIVYNDSVPFFIDKSGNEKFDINFLSLEPFENGKAHIWTSSGKAGIIDRKGKFIIDTVFRSIFDFNDGLAVVYGLGEKSYSEEKIEYPQTGVIDSTGKFVVPYGKYLTISGFVRGHAMVEKLRRTEEKEKYIRQLGYINKKGKLVFLRDKEDFYNYIYDNVYKGYLRIGVYNSAKLKNKRELSSKHIHMGIIDLNGKYLLNDTTYKYISEFSEDRAFARDFNQNYFLLSIEGKLVSQQKFKNVLGKGFNNGLAFVETEEGWGAIDTNSNFVIKPQFRKIYKAGLVGDMFFFYNYDPYKQRDCETLLGMADCKGTILLEPILQTFDRDGFRKGLLKAVIKNKFVYVNNKGKIVWKENEENENLVNLNVDFMRWGHYYITNRKPGKRYRYHAVWGESYAIPQKVLKSLNFPIIKISVIARPEEKDVFSDRYNGIRLYVVNNTFKPITFNVQSGRLYLKLQAKDRNGNWKDIEFLPSSFCGNSYYTIHLESQMYWSFVIPIYEGEFKTRMRAELKYVDPNYKREEITIYSNEFDGSVNPGQFWRQNYYYSDFMSPYSYWK